MTRKSASADPNTRDRRSGQEGFPKERRLGHGLAGCPPSVDFAAISIDTGAPLVGLPVNRQAFLFFPPPCGCVITANVGADLFPGS